MYRLAKKGFRLVSAPIGIKDQPYNLPVYEPLWNALEETGLIFSLHFITGTEGPSPGECRRREQRRLPLLHDNRHG